MRYSPTTNLNGRLTALERRVNAEPAKITVLWADAPDTPARIAEARARGETVIQMEWGDDRDYDQPVAA